MKICKICGEIEEYHHEPEWLEIPDGCDCDFREWDLTKTGLPPVCDEYKGNGKENCHNCEHDLECHKKP